MGSLYSSNQKNCKSDNHQYPNYKQEIFQDLRQHTKEKVEVQPAKLGMKLKLEE